MLPLSTSPFLTPAKALTRPDTAGGRQHTAPVSTYRHSRPPALRFGKDTIPGFPAETITAIQSVLSQCLYEKNIDALLRPDSGFEAFFIDGFLQLKHFNPPAPDKPPYKGVCNDLAWTAGKDLKNRLGPDFVVEVASGKCPNYFAGKGARHIFLLIWPKSEAAEVRLNLNTEPSRLPKNCLLVDPSFGLCATDLNGYIIDRTYPLQAVNPQKAGAQTVLHIPLGGRENLPLGYISRLLPEQAQTFGKQALLQMTIRRSLSNQLEVFPSVKRTPTSATEDLPDLLNHVSPDHPIKRLLNKVQTDINRPKPEQKARLIADI